MRKSKKKVSELKDKEKYKKNFETEHNHIFVITKIAITFPGWKKI